MNQTRILQSAILAILASALLSFTDNFVGMVSKEAGLWQFQLFRTLFSLPIIVAGIYFLKIPYRVKNLRVIIIRSVIISIGLLIYFTSLGFLSVAQAGAGLFSSPIWVLLFSIIFFKNKINLMQITAITAGFIGVLMLLQLDTQSLSIVSFFPLIAGAFYGFGMLITRHWSADESAATLTLGVFISMGIIGAIMLVILTTWPVESDEFILQGWKSPTPAFISLTFGQALAGVISVALITQAYKIGEPSFTAVFEYSFLVFAAFWSLLLWGQTTNSFAIIGILVIFASAISLSFLNNKSAVKSTSA
ncbi:DMT family transporter [Marinomonas sp. 15G1-11]|uniref:DMT family transporter n=1 Tax=Marinomonas phaeophyticola TaxID=3004091 RepID=A0ABT4JXH8_9GAMM|nr:DMT family transporter [Marinomonas sp. 15G1-11]MCZ2722921.1 DMT family transporter [Marinomonas sp. 15G1-11]